MTRRGPTNWYLHIAGVATLVCLRGDAQFSTRHGRNMFWLMLHDLVSRLP
jgi:hypothetical protein